MTKDIILNISFLKDNTYQSSAIKAINTVNT